jgi:hypothetical protein
VDKNEFFTKVQNHLKRTDNFIAVSDLNGNKLVKGGSVLKNQWNNEDINKQFGDFNGLMNALPSHGFKDTVTVKLSQKVNRTGKIPTTRLICSIDVQLKNDTPKTQPTPPQQEQPLKTNTMHPPQAPALQAPQPSLGMADIVSLKVKEERYNDMIERNRKIESELEDVKSENRTLKEDKRDLERKLDTLEDRYELKIERLEASQKKFWETETGKEALNAGIQILPQLAASLKGSTAPVSALGAGISQEKMQFLSELEKDSFPDEYLKVLGSVAYHIINTAGFDEELTQMLTNLNPATQEH